MTAGGAPLRVAFNGTALMSPLTGVGQYTFQLARGLRGRADVDLGLFYAAYFGQEVRTGAPAAVGRMRQWVRRHVPFAYDITRTVQQAFFSHGALRGDYDLYHEPNYLAYRFRGPTVITVHDLSWIRYPETHPAERVRAMHKYFEPGLRRATLLLADCAFVKQEIVDVFGIDPGKIVDIPLGLDPVFRPRDASATRPVLERLSLAHGAYFLSVGTLEPRKNLETTVTAYGSLPASLRDRFPLVLAGMKGWRTTAMEKVLEPLVASGHVRVLGYLEREELAAVTAGARAMVYPSLYEGFGFPPLEAMGCGVPAIASATSSLPEVVGDTGLLVEPRDVDAVARAMRQLAEDDALRDSLGEGAARRAATFTWERTVSATVDAYRRAAAISR